MNEEVRGVSSDQSINRVDTSPSVKKLWSIVLIEMTSHCNFSCSFCPSDCMARKKTIMKRELWAKILNEIAEKNMADTVFFHVLGEPLLHKDIFDAIAMANELGLAVSLYTNGALLDEERAEKLLNTLKKGRVVLSIQETEANSFEQRSRGNLSWKDYLHRLRIFIKLAEMNKYSIPVQIHYMIDMKGLGWNLMKINCERQRMQKTYDMWRSFIGFDKRNIINVFNPLKSYPLGKNSSFFVKYAGNWNNMLIDGDQVEVMPRKRGHCAVIGDTFAILSDGTCSYCCDDYEGELNLGNAYEKSLKEIYFGEKATRIRNASMEGVFTEKVCQRCRGALVSRKDGKPLYSRFYPSDFHVFIEHLNRYGLRSSARKIISRLFY